MKGKLILLFSIICFAVDAQSTTPQVVATSGDHYSTAQGSVSWTLGEIATDTYTSANNNLTQGFQQPHLILTGINEAMNSSKVNVYPNPVKDALTIDLQKLQSGTYTMEVYDATGKLMSKENSNNQMITLSMKALANGTYFLNIINVTEKQKASYQIQKID